MKELDLTELRQTLKNMGIVTDRVQKVETIKKFIYIEPNRDGTYRITISKAMELEPGDVIGGLLA